MKTLNGIPFETIVQDGIRTNACTGGMVQIQNLDSIFIEDRDHSVQELIDTYAKSPHPLKIDALLWAEHHHVGFLDEEMLDKCLEEDPEGFIRYKPDASRMTPHRWDRLLFFDPCGLLSSMGDIAPEDVFHKACDACPSVAIKMFRDRLSGERYNELYRMVAR